MQFRFRMLAGGVLAVLMLAAAAGTTVATGMSAAPGPAALPNARLAGDFDVTLRIREVYGIDVKRGAAVDAAWTFRPRCTRGACGVRMEIPPGMWGDKTARIKLKKSGKVYTGTGTAYLATCLLKPVAGPMSVKLTATAAAWLDGRLRVTKLAGTFRYTAPATSLCRSSLVAGTAKGALESAL